MKKITLQGLEFEPYISHEEIAKQVKRVAAEIIDDLDGDQEPIFICVLNGAFIFAADLYREVNLPHSQITFIRFKSYDGLSSTGEIREVMGLTTDITGRNIIIIEDIVDTGTTAAELIDVLSKQNPQSIKLATLLFRNLPQKSDSGTLHRFFGSRSRSSTVRASIPPVAVGRNCCSGSVHGWPLPGCCWYSANAWTHRSTDEVR